MTPKEKAEELFVKYAFLTISDMSDENFNQTKQCALIAVDEILKLNVFDYYESDWSNTIEYWNEVKQKIEKL